MRNLKKVLSLTVVLAMAFALMAGAFTDSESIVNTKAVDIVSALGVLKGYTDGSFQPEKVVTRAEMAKMIYVVKNGGKDDGATYYTGVSTGLTDIKGHWAEGYINYCYALGIIAGKGEGIFAPDAAVTGLEAAKMLLVVLGYNADKAGLVGSAWALKTAALASENGLFSDYSVAMDAGCPRDFAALMIYNAIDANTVRWSDDLGDYSNSSATGTDYASVGETYMDLKDQIGIFTGNYNTGDAAEEGQSDIAGTDIEYDIDISWIGEEVKVLYKDATTGVVGLDSEDTVFGVVKTGKTTVFTAAKSDIKSYTDNKDDTKLRVGSTEYKIVAGGANVYKNYDGANYGPMTVTAGNDTGLRTLKADSSDTIKFVRNNSGEITDLYVTEKMFSKVASVSSSKIQLEGISSIDLEDAVLYDGIAKDDIVYYITLYPSGDTQVTYVYPATTVEGEVDALQTTAKPRISGTFYGKGVVTKSKITDSDYGVSTFSVGDSFQLVMDGKYWVDAMAIETSAKDYAVCIGAEAASAGSTLDYGTVKLLLADGSKVTVSVHKDSAIKYLAADIVGTAYDETTSPIDTLFAYSLKDSGTTVKLTAVSSDTAAGATLNSKTKVVAFAGGSSAVLTSDAILFVKNTTSGDWKVYDANGVDSLTSTATADYALDSSKVEVLAMQKAGSVSGSADTSIYGYVSADPYTYEVDDEDYTDITLWTADGAKTITFEDDITTTIKKEMYVKVPNTAVTLSLSDAEYAYATDANYPIPAPVIDSKGAAKVKEVDTARNLITITTDTINASGSVVAGTDAYLKITSDTQYIYIDSFNKVGEETGSLSAYTKAYGEDWKNVYVMTEYNSSDAVNEIVAIFIDTDNVLYKGKVEVGQ